MRTIDQSEPSSHSFFREWLTAVELHREGLPGPLGSRRQCFRYVSEIRRSGNPAICRPRADVALSGKLGSPAGRGFEIHYTALPPEAIVAYEARYKTVLATSQPGDRRMAKKGKGVLSMAEGGRVRAFILQRLAADPKASAESIRDRCRDKFGPEVTIIPQGLPALVPMPPLRTFQHFIKELRESGASNVQP